MDHELSEEPQRLALCTALRDNLRGVRKFSEGSPRRRGGLRVKSFLIKKYSELCELRVSAVKSLFPFGCGCAALFVVLYLRA